MDWSWVPSTVTILATGAATTAGVWIKGILDARADARRIKVEETRFELEHQWAIEREKSEAQRRSEGARLESANTALKVFGVILDSIGLSDKETPQGTEVIWMASFESQARQAVEFIYDAKSRSDIGVILDVLEDFGTYCKVNDVQSWAGFHAKGLLQIVLQLAGAAARGEARSAETATLVEVVRDRFTKLKQWYADEDQPF